jgi:histidine triad (HIT) family protein
MESECIFCSIASGNTPADVVFDGGDTIFFRDIAPKAPIHVVGILKKHLESLDSMSGDDHFSAGKLLHDAAHVAREVGIADDGYRVLTNVGKNGGQEVPHLHIHILGGKQLGSIVC